MVFKRRDKPPLLRRLREMLLPQKGWRRGIEYLGHRVRRLPDTPHRISLGVACGVFVSFTPLFGFHFILAAAAARLVRGNMLASLIGTAFGNPLTFPFIASISLNLGRRIVGYGASGRDFERVTEAFKQFFAGVWDNFLRLFGQGHADWARLSIFIQDVFWPYLVGGILPGLVSAFGCYLLCRPIVAAYQARRRKMLIARLQTQADQQEATPSGNEDTPPPGPDSESDAGGKTPYIASKKTATK